MFDFEKGSGCEKGSKVIKIRLMKKCMIKCCHVKKTNAFYK